MQATHMTDSADQIDRIRAEMRQDAERARDFDSRVPVHLLTRHGPIIRPIMVASSDAFALLDALDAREARIKELEAGLRPFLGRSHRYGGAPDDALVSIRVGDLRTAARLLAPAAGSEGSRENG